MNTVLGAGVFVLTLAAQIAPVLAQAAGEGVGGVTPGAAFEAFRDALNVGVIGAVIWAIRWVVNNLGPELKEAVSRHNRLVEKLDQALDRMETNQDSVQRRLTELHQSLRQLEANKVNDEQKLRDIDAFLVGFPPASINPKILELAEQIMKHADDLLKRYQAPLPPPPPPPAPSGPMASMDAADTFWHEVA